MSPTAPQRTGVQLLDSLDAAGLTGRGGAAFPSAVKLRALTRRRTTLIVNACDGELGAVKDGWVVANHLDELLHGAQLVQRLARGDVMFAAHRGSATEQRLRAARVDVLDAPSRYVSSEESSLISLSQGGLARPMTKRSLYIQGGRDSTGRRIAPTAVLNAETVWRIAQIAERGPKWFRGYGTESEPGPRLASVGGYVGRPVVVETQAGVPVGELLSAARVPGDAEYVLINGLGGAFASLAGVSSASWSREGLAPFGARLGPGIFEVVDPRRCPLDAVSELLAYAAGESAGQCGPCMFGVPELSGLWQQYLRTPSARHRRALDINLGLLPGRGGCKFPDGVAGLAVNALAVFADHITEHASGRCRYATRRTA
ncbi:MAG TPA: NADH-ubiquinone oxidoreductase-F iron-sulfur binding region domain-containing protein [Propionibacteriaceae bacterium]|nr:NADH-ubiquinone oxidoreductase-F iron-sulfur binding region domain-containing protein [Propionibacteriaceae bacterium]